MTPNDSARFPVNRFDYEPFFGFSAILLMIQFIIPLPFATYCPWVPCGRTRQKTLTLLRNSFLQGLHSAGTAKPTTVQARSLGHTTCPPKILESD